MSKDDPNFNFGAFQSIREMATAHEFRTFFQKLDANMHLKIIERQMLDSIIQFIDDHNIDTSELRGRQTQILNSGIIMSAGSVQAESLAIGEHARAVSLQPDDYKRAKINSPPASTATRMPPV